jgi:N-acetylmuramoyl-L-alanine amidase
MSRLRSQHGWCLGVLLVSLLLPAPVSARARKSEAWSRAQFAAAERTREALNGRPVEERTRREYQKSIDAYRNVYYGSPSSTKADPSVVAVAELLAEMGRRFDDRKLLRSAIAQYQFLRREYPGSRYRFDALFTIGEIYKDDLEDPAKARETFNEFLRRYPRHHLAEEARKALAEPPEEEPEAAPLEATKQPAIESHDDLTPQSGKSAGLAHVTGIRHWSTPDYSRVAIDLEQDVKFQAQRIDNPDRIFFDLCDAKLASTLVGKSFEVEDGFLKKIRVAQFSSKCTRVVLEVDKVSEYSAFLLPNPSRLIVDIHGKASETARKKASPAPRDEAATAETDDDTDVTQPATEAKNSTSEAASEPKKAAIVKTGKPAPPVRKIVEADDSDNAKDTVKLASKTAPETTIPTVSKSRTKSKRGHKGKTEEPEILAREAKPTSSGDRSLIRALGLKIGKIVIDPGHGGHDTGTIGPNGLTEKEVVLDVGRRLGKLLEQRMGADVIFTRDDDTFIPLETRTAIANQEQADLFISIHANSSDDPAARGVETYYLNFTSSRDALEVAARENAVSDKSIHELQDLVKKIALKEKIDESREFAGDVQEALHSGLSARSSAIRNRGVKKAPFIVLIGANMPSILAEISFVSNPTDERKLETGQHRQRIAESLFQGISKYVGGLSGVKVASRLPKGPEQ